MSGGHFEYKQYHIANIVDSIKELIKNNHVEDEYGYKTDYSDETIAEFETAITKLNEAQLYAHRVDWLVCGDDSEESFHERLKQELKIICQLYQV